MSDEFGERRIFTTPERKREYIQKWLEENIKNNSDIKLDHNEKTPPSSPAMTIKTPEFLSPVHKKLLQGKRPATSPIIGGTRKNLKRCKLTKKKLIKSIESVSLRKDEGANFTYKKNFDVSKYESSESVKCEETVKFSDISKINDSRGITFPSRKNLKNFSEIFDDTEILASQLIESVSSDNKSITNSEVLVQEVNSETSKTASDLIEDLNCTQVALEKTLADARSVPLSQNISNPTSDSSEDGICDVKDSSKLCSSLINTNQDCTDSLTQIESIATLESKVDLSKTLYILQCSIDKSKKKKNPKKGSLLEQLISSIGKEKSSVNLLRHQIQKEEANIVEKPFVLLQIVQHLSEINDSQFLKCQLVEDTSSLLNDFLKGNTNKYITVINVPEISSIINTNHKPILKVYEPWSILDNDQMVMHITRFVPIPAKVNEALDIFEESLYDKNQVIHKNYCSCIDKKVFSQNCEFKVLKNTGNTLIKKIVDYD